MMTGGESAIKCASTSTFAPGGHVITYKSPLHVRKDTYDHSCYCTRSDEHRHSMTDPPAGLVKVVNIITRTSYYESVSMIGTGFVLNGRLARG
jgi:hypothetical protein